MQDERAELESLRAINGMMYIKPTQPSLCANRQKKIQPFATQVSQPGDTAQVIVNSGGDFVWGPTSYLRLEYTIQSGEVANQSLLTFWGISGSILNIFRSVRLTHRSGEQLEYIDEAGLLATILAYYTYDFSSHDSLLSLLNYNDNVTLVQNIPQTFVSVIPLSLLFGVFDTQECIPAALLSGCKMEIQYQIQNNAIALAANANTFIRDIKASLLLDTLQPYDSVVREINQQTSDSAASGIQFTYFTRFASNTVTGNSSATMDIQNSVSICSHVIAAFRKSAAINGDGLAGQRMATYAALTSLQYRLGSLYMPSQAMALSFNNQSEAYSDTLIAFKSFPRYFDEMHSNGTSVDVEEYTGNSGPLSSAASACQCVYAQTLDRCPTFDASKYSGNPTNNSRLLSIMYTKDAAAMAAGVDTLQTYTVSLRVCNCIGDSAVVDR